jgi:protein-S-isoprenylcysteine O-methyltransferase Ste14
MPLLLIVSSHANQTHRAPPRYKIPGFFSILLGSLWGLLTIVPITVVIVLRLLDEEKFLARNLPGYSDYSDKIGYRLLPYIW